MTTSRHRLDVAIGVVVGGLGGAIVAVNLIIFAGIGYDVTIPEVFRQNTFVGVVAVGVLLAGPVAGVVLMRRYRRNR